MIPNYNKIQQFKNKETKKTRAMTIKLIKTYTVLQEIYLITVMKKKKSKKKKKRSNNKNKKLYKKSF